MDLESDALPPDPPRHPQCKLVCKIDRYLTFYAQSTAKGHIRAKQIVFLPQVKIMIHVCKKLPLHYLHDFTEVRVFFGNYVDDTFEIWKGEWTFTERQFPTACSKASAIMTHYRRNLMGMREHLVINDVPLVTHGGWHWQYTSRQNALLYYLMVPSHHSDHQLRMVANKK